MTLAVVLSTRNGAATLPAVLAAHAALRPAGVPHRLVVVDNGSTDATPALLREAAARLPGMTLLHEPHPGKNRALNRALPTLLEAELVVFTDDDAVPEPDWLLRLWAAAQAQPGYAILGGAIRPRWLAPPPRWLFTWGVPLDICYADTATHRPGPIAADLVWGPNMAVRGAVLRQGHRFDTSVGPDGSPGYPMGSEIEFTLRLERAGHRAWFAPEAMVHHLVRPQQMTEAWVLQRAFRCGRGAARTAPPAPPRHLPALHGLPPGVLARLLAYGTAAALARRALPPGRTRFWLEWQAALMRGLADGLRQSRPASLGGPAEAHP